MKEFQPQVPSRALRLSGFPFGPTGPVLPYNVLADDRTHI